MACHGCSTSFGFLSKEVGCPSCGFSYCKKCLRFKVSEEGAKELAKTNPKSVIKKGTLICRNCNDRISNKSAKGPRSPGEIKDTANLVRNLQRLESVESKPPITLYQPPDAKLDKLKSGLSAADQKIVERLEELRSDSKQGRRKSDQTDEDVEARLARLRGEDPTIKSQPSKEILLTLKPETESELLNRLKEEVKLSADYDDNLVRDIEERLANLRPSSQPAAVPAELPNESSNAPLEGILDSDDDEGLTEQEQVEKLMKKYVAEVALEAKTGQATEGAGAGQEASDSQPMEITSSDHEESDIDNDQVCEYCNEKRAVLKCKTCDEDLFCKKCFHEFHTELGEIHKPTPI